jgi:hypothetical protein
MSSKSSSTVRELAQLMTVPDMLAARWVGRCHETRSTSGDRPEKAPGALPFLTGSCGAR